MLLNHTSQYSVEWMNQQVVCAGQCGYAVRTDDTQKKVKMVFMMLRRRCRLSLALFSLPFSIPLLVAVMFPRSGENVWLTFVRLDVFHV